MSCDSARLNLLAYVHGELAQGQREPLEEHLAACAACAHEARRLASEVHTLANCMAIAVPDDLQARILERLASPGAVQAEVQVLAQALVGPWPLARSKPLPAPYRFLRAAALSAAGLAAAVSGLELLAPWAYSLLASNTARVAAYTSELIGQHVTAWPHLLRAISALGSLAGL